MSSMSVVVQVSGEAAQGGFGSEAEEVGPCRWDGCVWSYCGVE
jgi:hypothetical protein